MFPACRIQPVSTHRFACLVAILLLAGHTHLASQNRSQPGPFTFIAIGDAGYPGPILENTAHAAQRESSRLANIGDSLNALLFLGDNFYPNGLNIEKDQRETMVEQVIGPHRPLMNALGKKNVLAIAGNHDYYCAMLGPAPYGRCFSGNFYESEIPEWTYHFAGPSSVRYATHSGATDSIELLLFDSALLLNSDRSEWQPYLDSMETVLRRSAENADVQWRLLFIHHSPYSVGKHAGYKVWDADAGQVAFTSNCIEEGDDPFKYPERLAGYHEDNCDPVYREYRDSLFAIIQRSGATVQAMFAGHDHNLQMLNDPARQTPPRIFVVSGAGSKQDKVRSSLPPFIFTHPHNTPEQKGRSAYGFVAGQVRGEQLHLWFVDGRDGSRLKMGEASEFVINRSGTLVETR